MNDEGLADAAAANDLFGITHLPTAHLIRGGHRPRRREAFRPPVAGAQRAPVVAVHESATVEDAIQHVRKSVSEEKAFELYVSTS